MGTSRTKSSHAFLLCDWMMFPTGDLPFRSNPIQRTSSSMTSRGRAASHERETQFGVFRTNHDLSKKQLGEEPASQQLFKPGYHFESNISAVDSEALHSYENRIGLSLNHTNSEGAGSSMQGGGIDICNVRKTNDSILDFLFKPQKSATSPKGPSFCKRDSEIDFSNVNECYPGRNPMGGHLQTNFASGHQNSFHDPEFLALEFGHSQDLDSDDEYEFESIFMDEEDVDQNGDAMTQWQYLENGTNTRIRENTEEQHTSSSPKRPKLSNMVAQMVQEELQTRQRFKKAMARTTQSQKALQEWDRKNGLPASHCQTMVNSSRSREQLQSGMVLQKWNGVPLMRLPGARVKIVRRKFRGVKLTEIE